MVDLLLDDWLDTGDNLESEEKKIPERENPSLLYR